MTNEPPIPGALEPPASATPPSDVAVAPAPDPVEGRIDASILNWKRKLLDFTKRNRALNFRANKVSTVTIVDEQPAEVFRLLALRGRSLRFKAAPEETEPGEPPTDAAPPESAETPAGGIEEEEAVSLGTDFVPYDPVTLDSRHTDEWLQTASVPEALDRSLRRLEEQARAAIEEQGVNTLFLALGMLHYTEADASEQVLRAPLVLLPVELSRRSARSGYELRASDDPIVNPALAEYLRPRGVVLPELPDPLPDDYDLQTFFAAATEQASAHRGWSVKTDVHLGLFSFQKFVMYKDLEANAPSVARHRLVRQLVGRSGDQVIGLPAEIRSMDLDAEYPPEKTFQVVDADSSQLRAIAACARDHDLVIEGPPGTGKSQTITNLIAQALAAGRSVLFVAEKMAALEVVYDRLVRAGLGEFCLELHSTKANKRVVMKELAATLDASFQPVAAPQGSTQRLPHVRHTLTEYARAVHTPFGALGATPYRAFGELGRVLDAPRVRLSAAIDAVSREQLDQTVRDLQDLAAASVEIGVPVRHPWRDTTRTFYSQDDLETVRETAEELASRAAEVSRRGAAVRETYGLPPVSRFADVDTAVAVAAVLGRSPGAPLAVLRSDAWNAPPAEAVALVERGRELARLRERVESRFAPAVLEQEHAADIAYVERKAEGIFSFLAFLDGRWRAIRGRWLGYRTPAFQGSLLDQANEMKQVDRLRVERAALTAAADRGRELFGELWQGEGSSWDALDGYVRWVVEFRGAYIRHALEPRAAEVAARPAPELVEVAALREAADGARTALARLREAVGWPDGYLADSPLEEVSGRAEALAREVARGPQWAAFESARKTVALGIAAELLPPAMSGELPFTYLAPAFLRAFYQKWLAAVVQEREPLERFHTLTHEERVAEFRALDQRVLQENRAALVGQLRDRIQQRLQQPDASAALPFLRREMAKQRNLSPLRRTLQQAQAAIRAIKPCLMMSPLSVAQFLDGSEPTFDLVVFDEASQLPAEDAVGAIVRGRQLVVVGDPKQLPPTDFFTVAAGQANAPVGEDGTPLYEDSESILEEFMGAGVPMSRLKWHYRSAHESLITFSNVSFYDAELYTFPSVDTGTEGAGLRFEHVADGVYEGKGLNLREAQRVADEVVRFAREQVERSARGEPALSLGVGTFNLRQQLAIQDELERRRREDPSIEPFFDRGAAEPFFVKNLENIQGDERDVIFISVTYARAADGKLRYNFGPLNGQNGWRRLNVLTTRARRRMRVFSSMKGDEINPSETTSDGARLLREFLLYAERGRLESAAAGAAADTESPFEQDVLAELTRHGVKVVPRVGVAGYRVDLGVLDDEVPGRFLCGIECDGAAYHSSETARDRDRLRQQVLEARGWTIHRVWSTDWFKDRAGQVERLLRLIETSRASARERAAAEREAREQAATRAVREAEQPARETPAAPLADREAAYTRPAALPYTFAPGEGKYSGRDLLAAPLGQLADAVVGVVTTEAPVHEAELSSRVAGQWGVRIGSRIQARIREAAAAAERDGLVERRSEFYWTPSAGEACPVRSRAGTGIPADRIAPEEYRAAVLAVLSRGHAFARTQLINEVRTMLGYSRTGAVLDEMIGGAVDTLLQEGKLGEASTGIRLRT